MIEQASTRLGNIKNKVREIMERAKEIDINAIDKFNETVTVTFNQTTQFMDEALTACESGRESAETLIVNVEDLNLPSDDPLYRANEKMVEVTNNANLATSYAIEAMELMRILANKNYEILKWAKTLSSDVNKIEMEKLKQKDMIIFQQEELKNLREERKEQRDEVFKAIRELRNEMFEFLERMKGIPVSEKKFERGLPQPPEPPQMPIPPKPPVVVFTPPSRETKLRNLIETFYKILKKSKHQDFRVFTGSNEYRELNDGEKEAIKLEIEKRLQREEENDNRNEPDSDDDADSPEQ